MTEGIKVISKEKAEEIDLDYGVIQIDRKHITEINLTSDLIEICISKE